MKRFPFQLLWTLLFFPPSLSASAADTIAFPSQAGVIDITNPPYDADRAGAEDATKAIQRALDDYPNAGRILYFPPGTYTISNTLEFGGEGGNAQKRTTLMGAGETLSVIRLADNAPLFDDRGSPRAMVWTGKSPAQRFGNEIMHLSFSTNGHPGAIGLRFMANNFGAVSSVTITDGNSGAGRIGLDMGYSDEIGPLLVRDLTVEGFDIGIRTFWQVNSIVFEDITLKNQRTYGVYNYHQIVTFRNLHVSGETTAVFNQKDANGLIALIDATFTGTGAASQLAAVHNQKHGFFRNVSRTGYAQLVNNDDKGRDCGDIDGESITESHSHCVVDHLFDSPEKTMNLLVKNPPAVSRHPEEEWASIMAYGATGDGKSDDTEALRSALNSGKKTIYLPGGKTFLLDGTIEIGGPVERVTGLRGKLKGSAVLKLVDRGGSDAPAVVVDGLRVGYGSEIVMEHASSRTLHLRHSVGVRPVGSGPGDFFISDIACGQARFENPQQRIWCRQLNIEIEDKPKIVNNGATLWILGLKTERGNVVAKTLNAGLTEILGAHIYSTAEEKTDPMFVIENAALSVAGLAERNFNGNPYQVWVRETRGEVTEELAASQVSRRGNFFYAGYSDDAVSAGQRPHGHVPRPAARNGMPTGLSTAHSAELFTVRGRRMGRTENPRSTFHRIPAAAGLMVVKTEDDIRSYPRVKE